MDLNLFKGYLIYVFVVLGVFGNGQLIMMFLLESETRNKSGFLLFLNAIFHLTCLILQPIQMTLSNNFPRFFKNVCIPLSALYLTIQALQACTALFMSVDLLLNIVAPFRYRFVSAKKFAFIVMGSLLVPLCFNFYDHYTGIQDTGGNLKHCFPLIILNHSKQLLWLVVQTCVVTATLLIYIAALICFRYRVNSSNNSSAQGFRSIITILGFFTVLCMFGVISELLLEIVDIDEETRYYCFRWVILHMSICFSQNFYVTIWRSSIYRAAFKSNMRRLFCCETRPRNLKNSISSVTRDDMSSTGWMMRRKTIL